MAREIVVGLGLLWVLGMIALCIVLMIGMVVYHLRAAHKAESAARQAAEQHAKGEG